MEQECQSSQARLSQCREELRQLSQRHRRPVSGVCVWACVCGKFKTIVLYINAINDYDTVTFCCSHDQIGYISIKVYIPPFICTFTFLSSLFRCCVAPGGRCGCSSFYSWLWWRLSCCGCGILLSGSKLKTSTQTSSHASKAMSWKWPLLKIQAVLDQYDIVTVHFYCIILSKTVLGCS